MASLRVATFNVCRDGQGMGMLGWAKRRTAVLSFLRGVRVHILALQEATTVQLADLDAVLGEMGFARAGARLDDDPGTERNLVYYRTGTLECLVSEAREVAGHPSRLQDGRTVGRSLRIAVLQDKRTQQTFPFVNLHLDPGRGGWRELAVEELLDNAALRRAVLAGDFNADPGSPVHGRLLGAGWRDTGAARGGDLHTFRNVLTGETRRIDWLLVPQDWAVITHAVLGEAGPAFSDHRLVLATVKPPAPRA